MSARSFVGLYESGGHRYAVRVVFSDESGTGSIKKEPTLIIGALMMNMDSQWAPVHEAVFHAWNNVKGLSYARELKGSKLLKMLHRHPDSGVGELIRIIVETLVQNCVPVFYEAVDRVGFEGEQPALKRLADTFPDLPQDAYSQAAGSCIRQVLQYVHTNIPREKVVWIADAASEHQKPTKASMRWHLLADLVVRHTGQSGRYEISVGAGQSAFSHLIDTIYFGDSKESLALQLADVCCSVIVGHLNGNDAVEPYYEILRKTIVAEKSIQFKSLAV